jgi:hypothetical protein
VAALVGEGDFLGLKISDLIPIFYVRSVDGGRNHLFVISIRIAAACRSKGDLLEDLGFSRKEACIIGAIRIVNPSPAVLVSSSVNDLAR